MDIFHKLLLFGTVLVSLQLSNCVKMTMEEREKFAMDMFKKVFVTTTSATTGEVSSQFGEIRADNLKDNTMAYQRMHSINVTGMLDDETIAEMLLPRCGVRSMADTSQDNKRKKRYAVHGTKWDNSSPLTYFMKNYSPDMSESTIDRVFKDAFQAWSEVTNLEFREGTSTNKDIEILFGSREHGDGAQSAFDGRSGTLAHAYFPQVRPGLGGDAHFDEDETWTDRTRSGINLYQVAVHELGHSLGLGHSTVRSAIMFPSYLGYDPNFRLDTDDIQGIQKLYGSKTQPTPRPTTTPTTTTTTTTTTARTTTTTRRTQRPGTTQFQTTTIPTTTTTTTTRRPTTNSDKTRFCANGRFDAITTFLGVTYVFKDDLYAVLTTTGIASGYPRPISEKFDGLQGISKIDAALSWDKHSTPRLYLFAGYRYWRYGRDGLVPLYPKSISAGFPGLPSNIGSAFVWGRNGRTYVFKGNYYYRLKGSGSQSQGYVDSGYPRSKSVWNIDSALPTVDAVFKWAVNGRTYMFSGEQYIMFDDINIGVQTRSIPYPRSTSTWWLRCSSGGIQDGQPTEHPAEMMEAEDLSDSFVVVPQADDNDNFHISSAVTLHQWSWAVLSVMVAVRLFTSS